MAEYRDEMVPLERDLSVFGDLGLKKQPVGVKFLYAKPEGVEKLERKLGLCEMIPEAQKGRVFYAGFSEHECAGPVPLGMMEMEPFYHSGQIGPCLEVFKEARANRRIYEHLSLLAEGSTFATGFAPVGRLTFDPDVLLIGCDNMDQGERLLRATQWDTGDVISSRITYVIGCNWLFTHPYVTGEINVVWTGICHGMTGYELHPPGLPIVALPWHHIDRVLRNIREMPAKLPAHTEEREEAHRRGGERLGVEGII